MLCMGIRVDELCFPHLPNPPYFPISPTSLTQVLFDHQLASVRSGTEKQLFHDSVAVHSVAKRYAALTSSMLLLMAEYDSDESGVWMNQVCGGRTMLLHVLSIV